MYISSNISKLGANPYKNSCLSSAVMYKMILLSYENGDGTFIGDSSATIMAHRVGYSIKPISFI